MLLMVNTVPFLIGQHSNNQLYSFCVIVSNMFLQYLEPI